MTAFRRDFCARVLLGSPFLEKEQNDEVFPQRRAPTAIGGRVIGDGGSEASQLRYHGQRKARLG
jgi:hypothetical protein